MSVVSATGGGTGSGGGVRRQMLNENKKVIRKLRSRSASSLEFLPLGCERFANKVYDKVGVLVVLLVYAFLFD